MEHWTPEPPDPDALAERIGDIQRLVRADVPNRDSLVEALIAENREAEKFRYAEVMADESIPLEERQRWGTPLTDEEIAALKAGGITFDKEIPPDKSPLLLGYRQIADLLIGSLTVEQAADRLGISVNEVRELAESRQLYAVDAKFGLNRFPAFQFTDDGLLPGFREVAPCIPVGMSMAAVESFFLLDNVDLYIDDDMDHTLSPIKWLRSGRDPKAVSQQLIRGLENY